MANAIRVTTGKARLSYVSLLSPMQDQSGKMKYRVTVLLPKSDTASKMEIDRAIAQAIEDAKATTWKGFVPPNVSIPIHDGDGVRPSGEPFGPECKGCWVFTASTNADPSRPGPQVVDAQIQPILNASEVYSGMYGRVSFAVKAYDVAGKKGIAFYLGNVQKLADGEPLTSSYSAASDFGGAAPQYQTPAQAQYQVPVQQQYQAPVQQQYQQPSPQQIQQYSGKIDPITGQPVPSYLGM